MTLFLFDHIYFLLVFTKDNNAEFYENIAIMVTNCSLNLGAHFSTMSAELNRRRIRLYVVSIITREFAIWNHYRTLAHSTGMHRFLFIFS